MMTKTSRWVPSSELTTIDWNDGALSALRHDEGWSIVRKTLDGQFAVVLAAGKLCKVVKVLPTLDRARAYNFAIGR